MGGIAFGDQMRNKYILVIDIGTTNIKSIIFDRDSYVVASSIQKIEAIFPKQGKVEYDPSKVWDTTTEVLTESLRRGGFSAKNIHAMGITNQRGTILLWDRRRGLPVYNAISWQDQRTSPLCDDLGKGDMGLLFCERMGDKVSPAFSITKVLWALQHVQHIRDRALDGNLLFGTLDSWILWKLTAGRVHATDNSNAASTHMVHRESQKWDEEILRLLDIPFSILPEIRPSGGFFGYTHPNILGGEVPIYSIMGDQQASLYGQACFEPGMAKCTYGTGSFVLMNIGEKPVPTARVAWTRPAGTTTFKLEGFAAATGSMLQWLFDEFLQSASVDESEKIAFGAKNSKGICVIPAFMGLQAPYYDSRAKGMITGLTLGIKKENIVRAFLESTAYICRAIIEEMQEKSGVKLNQLRIDGRGSRNNFLAQFQADSLGVDVERSALMESTAAGAAFMAGLSSGFWASEAELAEMWKKDRVFSPVIGQKLRDRMYGNWSRAAQLALSGNWGE